MMCPICGVELGKSAQSKDSLFHPLEPNCPLSIVIQRKRNWEYAQERVRRMVVDAKNNARRRIIFDIEDEMEV